MPIPKQRHTKSRRNRRRSHLRLKKQKLSSCQKCGEPVLAHHVCSFCGNYNGTQVIDVLARLEKKEKKKKEKELKEHEKEAQEEQKVKPLNLEELSKK
ncbi:MAG: 50S ribosomal protein L32 [Candidatus Portnoybacteria bacterium RBG_13_40_8]|uniref:Large ribosomal subunit protein bL32 n=1 Tax=Candidatus Portnoybacteria bacterium RBG_13_40_8 TaxID=1801990 RepID=A0A1G2F125_9BACT|nr:MAG: 50S ribosomal protein L32 [Candidatus Portnoybacteria bacterium RBG_13_40_8]